MDPKNCIYMYMYVCKMNSCLSPKKHRIYSVAEFDVKRGFGVLDRRTETFCLLDNEKNRDSDFTIDRLVQLDHVMNLLGSMDLYYHLIVRIGCNCERWGAWGLTTALRSRTTTRTGLDNDSRKTHISDRR